MQTAFTYNDILVKDVLTDSIEFTSEKESTGVDQIGIRCTATFTGIVHCAQTDHTGKKVDPFRGGLDALFKALSKDRRKFILTMGGQTIITVAPGAIEPTGPASQRTPNLLQMDIANGPQVQLQVTKITAGVSATIRFTINYMIVNCGDHASQNTNGLLNLRFWIAENIDMSTGLTSRVFAGKIRLAHKNIHPHLIARLVTIPSVQSGFKREYMRWDESPNGLELDFAIEDREIVAAPPYNAYAGYGATSWTGNLVHSTETMGATSSVVVSLQLTGPKNVSILELVDLAYRVIAQKLQYQKVIKGQQAFFEYFEVSEELSNNSIGCTARIKHTGANASLIGLFNLQGQPFVGQPMGDLGIGYDSNRAYIPDLTAGVATLFLSALQSPCMPNRMPTSQEQTSQPKPQFKTQAGGDDHGTDGRLEQLSQTVSESQLKAMYFSWRMTSELHHVTGRIPLANGASASSQESPISIVNLHRACDLRHVTIESERLNSPPELPSFLHNFIDVNGHTNTVIGTPKISPSAPQLSADGRNLLFAAEMDIWYALSKAINASHRIPVGTTPYRKTSESDPSRSLPPSTFVAPKSLLS